MSPESAGKAEHPVGRFCILLLTLSSVLLGGVYFYGYRKRPHIPQQPVPFSHATHTDTAGIPCLACHNGAETARGAGMPPDSVCLNCHRHILADDVRLAPLRTAADADALAYTATPLRWVRSAPLAAHVHFDHSRHAGITCAECHPAPDAQVPHSMSGCLDCHRRYNLPTDCSACHH